MDQGISLAAGHIEQLVGQLKNLPLKFVDQLLLPALVRRQDFDHRPQVDNFPRAINGAERVVVAGFLIWSTGQLWIDPVISLVIGAIIVAGTWRLMIDSLNMAMDAVPEGIDIAEVEKRLRALMTEDAKLWCEPHFVVDCGGGDSNSVQRAGAAWERILGQAQAREADLIVMGVHEPKGVPGAASHLEISTVHGVVAHARVPVLTVRGAMPAKI